jgi:hypothetical protein
MPSWEEMNASSISAFNAVAGDIGNTYQQVLYGGLSRNQDMTTDQLVNSPSPEYTRAEKEYVAQEQEKGRMDLAYRYGRLEVDHD